MTPRTHQRIDPDRAARLVRGGGLIVYPSDTVYGLGGDARRPDVAARARAAKGRGAAPMLVLSDVWDRVEAWVDPAEAEVARRLGSTPGVTVLARATAATPRHLVGAEGWVGLRLARGTCRALAAAAGAPLLSTSANLSGQPAPRCAADLDASLLARTDGCLVADGELGGEPSTVVRPGEGRFVVIRAGAVSADALARAVGLDVAG